MVVHGSCARRGVVILWIGHPRDLISCLVAMGAARCTDSACDCGGQVGAKELSLWGASHAWVLGGFL